MDRIVEKSLLFDFYGELLTQHQKEVYGEYIQNDLSPTEIAVLRGISRQGAYDLIKRCEKILTDYENRLHLVEHFQKVKKTVASIIPVQKRLRNVMISPLSERRLHRLQNCPATYWKSIKNREILLWHLRALLINYRMSLRI